MAARHVLLAALALAAWTSFALGALAGHGASACHGTVGTEAPVAAAGLLPIGGATTQGFHGVEGRRFLFQAHAANPSHGYVAWTLRDHATGAPWLSGFASDLQFPVLTEPVPFRALCLEILNQGTSARPYAWYLVDAGPLGQ